MFDSLGYLASTILGDISSDRVGARKEGLVIKDRRIDRSLLTENYESNWSVRVQGMERERQDHLLQRSRRSVVSPGRNRRMD